jgi:flagellar biogenesis protein FliO
MTNSLGGTHGLGGWAGWLLKRVRGGKSADRRLALVERIALAPRQSLALVEAEGRRILVATSPEGGPAFYPLDENRRAPGRVPSRAQSRLPSRGASRISW